jgi:hypothetical protein
MPLNKENDLNSELINRLAAEAGEHTNRAYTPPVRSKTPGVLWEPGHVSWHDIYQEKFAEVIVEHCLAQCVDYLSRHFIASHFGDEE